MNHLLVLYRLYRVWRKWPTLRLGQLVQNACYFQTSGTYDVDIFYVGNEDLILRLERWEKRTRPTHEGWL